MKCPYCAKEMKEGTIQTQHELNWLPKEAKCKWLGASMFHKDAIILSEASFLKGSAVVAYCCNECKKIIIEYNE